MAGINQEQALYTQDETKQYIKLYKSNPRYFTPEQTNTLKKHVDLYNLPFAESEFDNSFNIFRAVRSASEGYLSGFTTLQIGEEPRNTGESIARSVGQLGGFIGWTPHRLLGLGAKALQSTRLANMARTARAVAGQSVPMYISGKLTGATKKAVGHVIGKGMVGKAGAMSSVAKFLGKEVPSTLAESAFHLGTASAVSAWQGGIKNMISSFGHGAVSGVAFGAIGNIEVGDVQADKAIRMFASSMYVGLPATMKSATTEEQVYEYLLGAYFGSTKKPAYYQKGAGIVKESQELGLDSPIKHKNFYNLSKKAQDAALNIHNNAFGSAEQINKFVSIIAQKRNIPLLDAKLLFEESKSLHIAQKNAITPDGEKPTLAGITTKAKQENPDAYPLHSDYFFPEITDLYKLKQSTRGYVERYTDHWRLGKNLTAKQLEKNLLNDSLKLQEHFESTIWNRKKGAETRSYSDAMSDFLVKDGYISKPFTPDSQEGRIWTQKGLLAQKGVYSQYYSPKIGKTNNELIELQKGDATTPSGKERNARRPIYKIETLYNDITERRKAQGLKTKPFNDVIHIVDHVYKNTKYGDREFKIYNADPSDIRFVNGQMRAKGLYHHSGRGDAHNMYYVPMHPDIAELSPANISRRFNEFKNYSIKKGYATKKQPELDFKMFVKSEVGEGFYKRLDILGKAKVRQEYQRQTLSNVAYDANLEGYKSITEMESGQWVDNAIKFNKRQSIWMSAGYEGDMTLVPKNYKLIDKDGESYMNVLYVNDVDSRVDQSTLHAGSKASDYLHSGDGTFYMIPEQISIQNRVSGKTQNGLEKSNMISDSTLGTGLGKYMIADVPVEQAKWMREMNIQGIMPLSSAKQYGKRSVYDLDFVGGKTSDRYMITDQKTGQIMTPRGVQVEQVKLKNFKHILSENMDVSRSGSKTPFFKQMYTTISPYTPHGLNKLTVENYTSIIEDMYNGLTRSSIDGKQEWNLKLKDLTSVPVENQNFDEVIKNIDKVGLREIGDAVRSRNADRFVSKIIDKLIDRTSIHMRELAQSGDVSPEEYSRFLAQENVMRNPARRQIGLGSGSSAMYTHPYTQPYVDQIFKQYAYSRAVNPKPGNTYKQRIVPYSHELRIRKDKLGETYQLNNKNQRVEKGSMLHKLYGNIKSDQLVFFNNHTLDSPVFFEGKEKPLGKIWKDFIKLSEGNAPTAKLAPYKALFKTLNVRVPLSSVSGAQVLYFGGFTGINSNGILLHPRAMELMDGADLDGDTATTFFGGREIHGKGMKSSWLKLYGDSASEFYKKDKQDGKDVLRLTDAKESLDLFDKEGRTYRQLHTHSDPEYLDYMHSRLSTWGPGARFQAAAGAARGREVLSTAVTFKSKLQATYAALRGSGKGVLEINDYKGNTHYYKLKLKPKNIQHFLETTRAQIALASDPMNEAGLLTAAEFKANAFKTLFEYKNSKKSNGRSFELISPYNKAINGDSLLKDIGVINKLIWGRNTAGRRYSGRDIHALLQYTMDKYPDMKHNNFMLKVADDMQHVNMGVDILDKVDFGKFEKTLDSFNTEVSKPKSAYDSLRKHMGYDSLRIPFSPLHKEIIKSRIWEQETRRKHLLSTDLSDPFTFKIFEWARRKDPRTGKGISWKEFLSQKDSKYLNRWAKDPERRNYIISEVIRQARDWTSENLHTMASASLLKRKMLAMKADKIPIVIDDKGKKRDIINELIERSDELKSGSWLNSKYNDRKRKLYTSHEIDEKIKDMFNEVSDPKVKKAFTQFFHASLFGSYQSRKAVEAAGKLKDGRLYKTKMSRIAPTSNAIPNEDLAEAYGTYNSLFKHVGKNRYAVDINKEVKVVDDFYDENEFKKVALADIPEGKVIQTERLIEQDRNYIDHKAWRVLEGKIPEKLDKKWQPVLNKLEKNLTEYENAETPWNVYMNDFFRSIVGKDLNKMDMVDFQSVNTWFKDMKGKLSWIEKGKKLDLSKGLPMSPWHYFLFPRAIGEQLIKTGIRLKPTISAYKSKRGTIIGNVMKPSNVIETLQETIEKSNTRKRRQIEVFRQDFKSNFEKYTVDNPDFDILWEIMAIQREANPLNINKFTKGFEDKTVKEIRDTYQLRRREVETVHKWNEIKNKKKFKVNLGSGNIEILTGNEVVKQLDKLVTKHVTNMHTWLTGNEKIYNNFVKKDKHGNFMLHEDGTPVINFSRALKDKNRSFFGFIADHLHNNKNVPLDGIGMDGMERIVRSLELQEIEMQQKRIVSAAAQTRDTQVRNYYLRQNEALAKYKAKLVKHPPKETGRMDYRFYYPHVNNDPVITADWVKGKILEVRKNPNLNKNQKTVEEKRLLQSYARARGGYQNILQEDILMQDAQIRSILSVISDTQEARNQRNLWTSQYNKNKSQLQRKYHTPGWSLNYEDFISSYGEGIITSYYNNISQVMAKLHISEFEKIGMRGWDDGIRNAWSNWLRAYTQSSLGNPIVIPDEVAHDPKMRMKGVFAKWRDNHVAETVNKMADKLGLRKKKTPEQFKALTQVTPERIVQWSNMEARYQLATLLAHPKSSMNNLFGGTMHTIESTGLKNFARAKSLKHIQATIDTKFKTWDDVNSWLHKMGIQEEFMVEELKLNPKFRLIKQKGALKELTNAVMSGKKADIPKILKKYKISKTLFQKAAWFMHKPETILRRDAFLAHYLQAYENLGGIVDDPKSNPYLIEMAKKGVRATQFLYSAPFRPMFANTGLGKVMTRFQLWAWNSVRFRNDVMRQAKIAGYRPGSVDFERLKRTAMIDMFTIAAANAFTYSLFETALPQPYAWFQDIADFLFGDTKERERAFYGAYPGYMAPLQMATPPSARMVGPTINALYSNDWSKLANYHVWTMFPFGRIGRDVLGIYKNPGMTIEKVSGLPYKKLSRYKAQLEKRNIPKHHALAIGYNRIMPSTIRSQKNLKKLVEKLEAEEKQPKQ